MSVSTITGNPASFSELLFAKMSLIHPGIGDLELYEFRYALDLLAPKLGGWSSIRPDEPQAIEHHITSAHFFRSIEHKPRQNDHIVLDKSILSLTQMLMVGLVTGDYPVEWINDRFYFDLRGFFFLPRTQYLTREVIDHIGGMPYHAFIPKQKEFDRLQEIGYKAFKEANAEVDACFIEIVKKLITIKGVPIILAIAGPTAAGKTEIVERLRFAFASSRHSLTSIELDNFFTDRDDREARGIDSLGRDAIHLSILTHSLTEIIRGKTISIPRYDFIDGSSSHDLSGNLKPGRSPVIIEPADIIFIEGNFPFLLDEIAPLIRIKVVYLTADDVRLKRKWRRDIDLRQKYDPYYLCNRYFKDQFLMAQECFLPQLQRCDILVDTTGATLWLTPQLRKILD